MTDKWYLNPCCMFSCSSAHVLKVIFEKYKKTFSRPCMQRKYSLYFLFYFSCHLQGMTKKDQYCSKFRQRLTQWLIQSIPICSLQRTISSFTSKIGVAFVSKFGPLRIAEFVHIEKVSISFTNILLLARILRDVILHSIGHRKQAFYRDLVRVILP